MGSLAVAAIRDAANDHAIECGVGGQRREPIFGRPFGHSISGHSCGRGRGADTHARPGDPRRCSDTPSAIPLLSEAGGCLSSPSAVFPRNSASTRRIGLTHRPLRKAFAGLLRLDLNRASSIHARFVDTRK
jgi:hypothetical protein